MTFDDAAVQAIDAALDKCGGRARRLGPARWQVALANGRPLDVAASADASREWLTLDAALGPLGDPDAGWRALGLGGAIGGLGKLVLADSVLHLRADVPLERRDALASRLARACAGFKHAVDVWEHGAGAKQDRVGLDARAPDRQPDAPFGELADLCRDAGWNVSERASGRVTVTLDCARRFYQAVIEPAVEGGVRVSATLIATTTRLATAPRRAVAWLLLETAGLVRLARAAAAEGDAGATVGFEVVFDEVPDRGDLDHALASLSAACERAGDEARALQHDAVVARYLALLTGDSMGTRRHR